MGTSGAKRNIRPSSTSAESSKVKVNAPLVFQKSELSADDATTSRSSLSRRSPNCDVVDALSPWHVTSGNSVAVVATTTSATSRKAVNSGNKQPTRGFPLTTEL